MDDNVCEYCNGPIEKKKVTVQYNYHGQLVLIEDVPAGVCRHCGERYYDAQVVKAMERIAESRQEHRAPIRVIQTPVFEFAA